MDLQYSSNMPLSRLSISFDQPRRITFGPGTAGQAGAEAKRLGAGKVLLVTDAGVQKAGLAGKVSTTLERDGLQVTTYDKIAAEPTMDSVRAGVEFARANAYKVVVAVGGGSVMDTAKIMANLIANPGDPEHYLTPVEDRFKNPSAPKILIPTTSGTGSEVSNYSVVIEKKTLYKTWAASSNLLAEVALVDPVMTSTCPPRVTAGSGLDVGGHNMEGLISREANPLSDSLATEAVKLIFAHLRKAYHNGDDIEARSGMSMASMFGGSVIAFPWIGGPAILGHCLAEALGPKYGVAHGIMVGVCLPYILHYNAPACTEKIASFAPALGIDTHGMKARDAAEAVPQAVLQLMRDVELPTTLKKVGVPKSEMEAFAEYIVNDRQHVYNLPKYNPRRLTLESIVQLLDEMYEGALES